MDSGEVSEHLTKQQIERYIARKGSADEILAAAQHLEDCFECRDKTAALVDDGSGDRPHERDRSRRR
ncbi:MAG: hypothetical protein QOE68_875 [Thermoanaerobaculia bacterium]|jgi:hypothetical protein|nr:hypothetical protein [Thermoanaerobaculia bacterium]